MVYLLSMVSPVVFICNFVCSFADFVVKYLRHVARNFGREVYYILQVIVSSFIIIGVHYAGDASCRCGADADRVGKSSESVQ